MRFAYVTLNDGTVITPVLLAEDHIGIRFYAADKGRVRLLGAIVGGKVKDWGTKVVERHPVTNVRTAVRRTGVITGDLPADFRSVAYLGGCQCGHALKSYRPPFDWEPLP